PYTIYHIPYTIYHIPYTIHHIPYTIHHIPYTIYHTQILVDIPRTASSLPLFSQPLVRKMMERTLYIFAIRHPACGYVQGMVYGV
ncbi:hypothetical protein EON63_20730, partial [archaeon]